MPKSNTDAFPAHGNHYGKTVLRDMGYFSLNEFDEIEQREAWWLTRLPLTTGILLADGYTLEKYLVTKGQAFCQTLFSTWFCGRGSV